MIRKMKYRPSVITRLAYEPWQRDTPSHLRAGITCAIYQNSVVDAWISYQVLALCDGNTTRLAGYALCILGSFPKLIN